MELYLAPMEEVTTYIFRNALNKHFGYVDKYFTPFVTPNQNKILKTKEGREIVPEHNEGLNVVPQVLTNNAEQFNELAETLRELGYKEINLNFGCPSNTVVKKYRGSGILRDTLLLDEFLKGIYIDKNADLKISVKTRVGYTTDEFFDEILNIYEKYPMEELIIHPRIQKDFYSGLPRMEKFDAAYSYCKNSLCYNGNIFSVNDFQRINKNYSKIKAVMIGRGAISNPGLFREIRTGQKMTDEELYNFIDELYLNYANAFSPKDGLFKMKEVWSYLISYLDKKILDDNNIVPIDISKEIRVIRKTTEISEYKDAVRRIFNMRK